MGLRNLRDDHLVHAPEMKDLFSAAGRATRRPPIVSPLSAQEDCNTHSSLFFPVAANIRLSINTVGVKTHPPQPDPGDSSGLCYSRNSPWGCLKPLLELPSCHWAVLCPILPPSTPFRFGSHQRILIKHFPEPLSQNLILVEPSLKQHVYLRGATSDIAGNVMDSMV